MFEEEEKWSWEKTTEATRCDTHEWGDVKEDDEAVKKSAIGEEGQLEQGEASGSGSFTPTSVNNPVQRRIRRKLVWIEDYLSSFVRRRRNAATSYAHLIK